jgi:2-dehydropantoate 2-reductase
MRGVTLPAARVARPGVVESYGSGTTWLGPFEPRPAALDEVQQLGQLLNRSGLETRAVADARGAQWTKLLFNCATNPLCALTGLTHGQLWELPATRAVVGEVLREGRAVADACAIDLEEDPEELVDALLARRPTEIGTLNEGLVAEADTHGIAAPVNRAVAALVRGLEDSWGRQR